MKPLLYSQAGASGAVEDASGQSCSEIALSAGHAEMARQLEAWTVYRSDGGFEGFEGLGGDSDGDGGAGRGGGGSGESSDTEENPYVARRPLRYRQVNVHVADCAPRVGRRLAHPPCAPWLGRYDVVKMYSSEALSGSVEAEAAAVGAELQIPAPWAEVLLEARERDRARESGKGARAGGRGGRRGGALGS